MIDRSLRHYFLNQHFDKLCVTVRDKLAKTIPMKISIGIKHPVFIPVFLVLSEAKFYNLGSFFVSSSTINIVPYGKIIFRRKSNRNHRHHWGSPFVAYGSGPVVVLLFLS